MKIFEDLESRGLIKQTTNKEKLRELLNGEPITFYVGFDPTADSLHVGHLLQVVTAMRLMKAGHRPIMLVGGATALVGDPTGKSEMRQMLDDSVIRANGHAIHSQLEKIMGFPVLTANNLEWFQGMEFLRVVREIGRHFSVNNMLRADCFKSRMEHGLSFLEFNYMIMQAIDFNYLHNRHDCVLQIGGDDQWSNILAGIDLIHKISLGTRETFGLTLPLLVNSSGTKMGKTEKGTVWLDPNKTDPFEFFQFWRNAPDDKVVECFNFFTNLPALPKPDEIKEINIAKKQLAFEITKMVHGEDAANAAQERAEALFEGQDTHQMDADPLEEGTQILDLLVRCGFAKSRTAGRHLIDGKGITINDEVLSDPTMIITKSQFGEFVMLRKGKKHFHRFQITKASK